MAGAASGLRVLELTQGMAGSLAGMVLSDQGAEVVKIEEPGGDPFVSEAGFRLWSRGKRRFQLDLEHQGARETLLGLARAADVALISVRPSQAESLGLSYETLKEANPGLVFATISGYGWRGPYRDEDLLDGLVHARSGSMLSPQNGGSREGPIFVAPRIASYAAAMTCVQGVLGALHVRETTGRGQHVDASLLLGNLCYRGNGLMRAAARQDELPQQPAARDSRGVRPLFNLAQCSDGRWLSMAAFTRAFCEVALGVMGLKHVLEDPRFQGMPNAFANDDDRDALLNILWDTFAEAPMQEWIDRMWEAKVPCEPVLDIEEFRRHEQLWANQLAVTVNDPVVGPMVQPGLLSALSETPGEIRPAEAEPEPADALGEVLARWSDAATGTPSGNGGGSGGAFRRGPLTGVKVLDFTAFVAGPMCGRLLADLGADVTKVEPPEGENFRGPSMVTSFALLNRGKKGVVIDLKDPRSKELLHTLVRETDIVVYNYRLGVEARLGLDYETLRQVNPKIILCRITAFGPDGPQAYRPGYETSISALSGNYIQQAGEGNPPATFGASDISSGIAGATNILMALRARDRTGLGQHVEGTMIGTLAYVTADGFTDYAGKAPRPKVDAGQHRTDPLYSLYRSSDGWVFLAATQERQWRALRDTAGGAELLDEAFSTDETRKEHAKRLTQVLSDVFQSRTTGEWVSLLEPAGVPCVDPVVDTGEFVNNDPSLATIAVTHIPHGRFQTLTEPGPPVQLSETPCAVDHPEPGLGEHTESVLRDIGMSDAAVREMEEAGTIRAGGPVV